MCDTCKTLQQQIDQAIADGREEKARVLMTILDGHKANTCRELQRYNALIKWSNGSTWITMG